MNSQELYEDALRRMASEVAKNAAADAVLKAGLRAVNEAATPIYVSVLREQLLAGAPREVAGLAATTATALHAAGRLSIVEQLTSDAGKAAGFLAGPALEVTLLRNDGRPHSLAEYAGAAGGNATRYAVRKAAVNLSSAATTKAGQRLIQRTVEQAYVPALRRAILSGGVQNAGLRATAEIAPQAAKVLSWTDKASPVAGKLGGIGAGAAIEVFILSRDGQHHEPVEYAKVAGRNVTAGVAGLIAESLATACTAAVIGSTVPILGTALGFFVGVAASVVVNQNLKAIW